MNRRTQKRWAKRAEPDAIMASFRREFKRLDKHKWARTICTVVPDGPNHVWLSATVIPFPRGYMRVRQAIHKGRKP